MSLLFGEDINLGVATQNPADRKTAVRPLAWIPGRAPHGMNLELTKTLLKETKGGGVVSQSSEIVQRKASGDFEFNVRSETFGYILLSLLGKITDSGPVSGVYTHLVEILRHNPEFPLLSGAMASKNQAEYQYPGMMIKDVEIKFPVDDLVSAKTSILALDEQANSGATYDPTFEETDYFFRPQDVEIKLADNLAGLAGATKIDVKELSLKITNNGKNQQHIGSATPTNNIANLISISGNITIDYQNDDYHDIFAAGTYKAMQIKLERSDIDLGGGAHPSIIFQMSKVSFEGSKPNRPIDDIVMDSFDFTGHYDETEDEAINVQIINEVPDYDYQVGSGS